MTLADVISPLSIDEFLHSYVGERHLVVRGPAGRFASLLSWAQLNDTLSCLRVDNGRVSLVHDGHGVPRDSYVQTSRTGKAEYLIGPGVAGHIAQGATLVVNQIDEFIPAIRRLAESCEDVFHVYVAANLYAGWRRVKGFDVHWDSHDTLIIQIMGKKEWRVWTPTRHHPISGDNRTLAPPPTADPVFQGTLEEGDVLYMPRGWWHVASPMNELSAHLTFGINHPTGLSLLEWAVQQAREQVEVRMNVPSWLAPEDQALWSESVRNALVSVMSSDVVQRYVTSQDDRAHVRPIVRLPRDLKSADAQIIDDWTPLRLWRGRRLYLSPRNDGATVTFEVEGKRWLCQAGLAPALSLLNHVTPCTLNEMVRLVDDSAKPALRPFLTALVTANIVWAEPVAAGCPSRGTD